MNRRPALVVACSILAVSGLGGVSAGAAAPGAPTASGEARVDGKPLKLAHAYLFHAPDAWEAKQVNAVALLTPKPLDEAKLRAATTLQVALDLAPERVVVEVPPAGPKAELKICHPGFGKDWCYSTTIHPPEWSVAKAAERGRLVDRTRRLEQELEDRERYGNIIGSSPLMLEVYRMVDSVAHSTSTVLTSGQPTGATNPVSTS